MTIELYSRELRALRRSADPYMEDLRLAFSSTDVEALRPKDMNALETMVMTSAGTRETAYTALYREGFLYVDLDRVAFRKFKPAEMDEHLELLSAYEAVAILRSRSMKLKPSVPALAARYQEFCAAFVTGEVLDVILGFQRLMLTVVAATASDKLMRMYASTVCVAYAYAWAQRTAPALIGNLRAPVDEFYCLYMEGDQVSAARIISEIRAVGLGVGCLAQSLKPA